MYEQALAKGKPGAALLNNAANHYLACGRPAQAREFYAKLLSLNPGHVNANLQLARLAVESREPFAHRYLLRLSANSDPEILSEAGMLYARLGEYRRAQEVFQRVVAAKPGVFEGLWNLGRASARAGDLVRAREALDAALRLRPEDGGVLFELGTVQAAAGEMTQAVYLLARAHDKLPGEPNVTLALARASQDAGFYGDAAVAYDRYVKLRPDDEAARRDRARALANVEERAEEGRRELGAYVARRPDDPVGHFQLAQICWKDDPEKSLAHLAEAVRLDAKLAPAHTATAWLLRRLGRDAEAIPHLEVALKLSPGDVHALDQYGLALLTLERTAEAVKAFRRGAAASANDWEVRLHLGRALMETGNEAEAKKWLDEYKRLRPSRQRDPRREAGMIELAVLPESERRAREIQRFRQLVESRPDDARLRIPLAALLLADGRASDAERELTELLNRSGEEPLIAEAGRLLLNAGHAALAIPYLKRAGMALDLALAEMQVNGPGAALEIVQRIPPEEHTSDVHLLKAKILDELGESAEARELLRGAKGWTQARPNLVGRAALQLSRYGDHVEAAQVIAFALTVEPNNRDLLLAEALSLALGGRSAEAELKLSRLEERWPEWDRPYRLHAVILAELKRTSEAQRKRNTYAALAGLPDGACAQLRDWLAPPCVGGPW